MSNHEYGESQHNYELQRNQNALTIVKFILNIPFWKMAAVRNRPLPGPAPFGPELNVLNQPDAELIELVNGSIFAIGGIPATLTNGGHVTPVDLMSWHGVNVMIPGHHNWMGQLPGGAAPLSVDMGELQDDLVATITQLQLPHASNLNHELPNWYPSNTRM